LRILLDNNLLSVEGDSIALMVIDYSEGYYICYQLTRYCDLPKVIDDILNYRDDLVEPYLTPPIENPEDYLENLSI